MVRCEAANNAYGMESGHSLAGRDLLFPHFCLRMSIDLALLDAIRSD
jgi:hypothetical protein